MGLGAWGIRHGAISANLFLNRESVEGSLKKMNIEHANVQHRMLNGKILRND